jgi:hypothetical protein
MTRVHVICEGQTEERFVNTVLVPALSNKGIHLYPTLIGKKGGTIRYDRIRLDIRNFLLGDTTSYCTTFFDYYGLPEDFPGKQSAYAMRSIMEKFQGVTQAFVEALSNSIDTNALQRFVPYVQMHEFEALLFSDPAGFARGIGQPALTSPLQKVRNEFKTPEDINDSPMTAPSKRVLALCPQYDKPLHGSLAADAITLSAIRGECSLFNQWLETLGALP